MVLQDFRQLSVALPAQTRALLSYLSKRPLSPRERKTLIYPGGRRGREREGGREREMERKAIVVCSVVGLLGALSAATGFAAEATRIKGSQVQFTSADHCVYPRTPALGLGVTAAVSLMLAHIIINVVSGCICCRRNDQTSNSNWRVAFICFTVSWFAFVIAFLLLLTGAALNDQHNAENMYFGSYYCYVVKPGVFAGGSILGLASITLGILYYLTLNPAKTSNSAWGNSPAPNHNGVAMGQPQFPPQMTQGPVFVHEDGYIRRQLAG